MPTLEITGLTHIGQIREENQDAIAWQTSPQLGFGHLVVCDGMGGYSGGAIASTLAVETIDRDLAAIPGTWFLARSLDDQLAYIKQALIDTTQRANQLIVEHQQLHPENGQMGTTVVAMVIWNRHLVTAHVGDSRGYLWQQNQLQPLTRDDSLVQDMIDSGQLEADEAESYPSKNVLTMALGAQATVLPTISDINLQSHSIVLACSDGLTNYLSDVDINDAINSGYQLTETCNRLIERANTLGGKDNISVLMAEID